MKKWYSMSYIDILKGLNSNLDEGLNYIQVEKSKDAYGNNVILTPNKSSFMKILLKELIKPWSSFIILYIILTLYFREIKLSFITLGMYSFILATFIYFRVRDQKGLEALEVLNSSNVEVVREGIHENINIEGLVIGDIVFLEANTYIPADIRLIETNNFKVNELAVTGKNYVVEKFSARLDEEELEITEISNMVFKSTVVKQGKAKGIVVATGMETEIGSIMKAQLNRDKEENTFLKSVEGTLNKFAITGVLLSFITAIISIVLGMNKREVLDSILNIFFSAVPFITVIFFIFVVMIFLHREKKKGIEITNLTSLKNITNMKTFFLDKKGILSKDEMHINKVFIDNKLLKMSSSSSFEIEKYYDENNTKKEDKVITVSNSNTLERLISISLLCNDATYIKDDDVEKGDIKEIAMIKFGMNNLLYKNELQNKFTRVNEISLDGDKKIKTTINNIGKKYRANVVGALEKMLERSTHVLRNGIEVELTKDEIEVIKEGALDISMDGMEPIAFAYRNFKYNPSLDENIESNLVFVGLMGIINPIKEESYKFNTKVVELGLNPIIFTDENKISAKVFGKELEIIQDYNQIYSGIEFKYMAEHEVKNISTKENIFSKLTEEQKVMIVQEHKKQNSHIGILGSKLTDVPHVSEGEVTISFGEKVSNILKKITHIYMKDGNINNFFEMICESRALINLYKKVINQNVLTSSALVLSMLLTTNINKKVILDLRQLTYISMFVTFLGVLSIFMQYRKDVFLKDDNINFLRCNEEDNSSTTFFFLKGIFIGLIAYIAYTFGIIKYNEETGKMLYMFSIGIGLAFSPLNTNVNGKILKGFLSNFVMVLNVVNIFAFMTLESVNYKLYSFNVFLKEKYVVIIILILINYLINIVFRKENKKEEEMYMYY